MSTSKRYAEHYDRLMRERIADGAVPPCTLPLQAYGPESIEWCKPPRPAVWAWVQWPQKPAERIAATAVGWNDRVVIIVWNGDRGELNTVVWRNAVTRRSEGSTGVRATT